MKRKQLKTIVIECPSERCKGERRLYEFKGYEGVPWKQVAVYRCHLCDTKMYRNKE